MRKKIAIDTGKFNTKGYSLLNGEKKRVLFRTQMMETEEHLAKGDENFVVEFEDKKYMLGKKANSGDFHTEKKSLLHKISAYTTIAQFIEDGDEVDVAIGYPISLFKNVQLREGMEEFILGNKLVEMVIDGEPISFKINSVKVMPESSGVIFKDFKKYKDLTAGVIDWGGLNINGCIFQDGDIVEGTYFTLNKGVNILWNELKNALNKKFGTNIQDYQRRDILNDGYIINNKNESKEFIKGFIIDFIRDEIITEAEKKQWDFGTLKHIAFAGGGSMDFQNYITHVFENANISENGVWDNVEGFGFVIGI